MRLKTLPAVDLSPAQKSLFAQMQKEIPPDFTSFQVYNDKGEFMGPWNAWLHQPEFGNPIWALSHAVCAKSSLSDRVCQIVILTVGAKYKAAYELYAHETVAKKDGFSQHDLDCLLKNTKPKHLSPQEDLAFNMTMALLEGNVLPKPIYDAAVQAFGDQAVAQIIYLVGFYCLVSITLNAYAIPAPKTKP